MTSVVVDDLNVILQDVLPVDHAAQTQAEDMLHSLLARHDGPFAVLDLGCGDGRAVALFDRCGDRASYSGVDIEGSPEVSARRIADPRLHTYDGINLPFPDRQFDCIWSKQVFEHVVHPRALLKEVVRTLKPGGRFIGSVSFLEPYHSFSTFGFSPYGLSLVLKEAGFASVLLRPGIDGVTLSLRSFLPTWPILDSYWHRESPLNAWIDRRARKGGWSVPRTASVKLRYAGQIAFEARTPTSD
jgi:SAM-dependent methyltransferase